MIKRNYNNDCLVNELQVREYKNDTTKNIDIYPRDELKNNLNYIINIMRQ